MASIDVNSFDLRGKASSPGSLESHKRCKPTLENFKKVYQREWPRAGSITRCKWWRTYHMDSRRWELVAHGIVQGLTWYNSTRGERMRILEDVLFEEAA